jgi:hypothetical protein
MGTVIVAIYERAGLASEPYPWINELPDVKTKKLLFAEQTNPFGLYNEGPMG